MIKQRISPAHFVLIPRIKMKAGCKQQDVQVQMERMFKKAGLLVNGENFSPGRVVNHNDKRVSVEHRTMLAWMLPICANLFALRTRSVSSAWVF